MVGVGWEGGTGHQVIGANTVKVKDRGEFLALAVIPGNIMFAVPCLDTAASAVENLKTYCVFPCLVRSML